MLCLGLSVFFVSLSLYAIGWSVAFSAHSHLENLNAINFKEHDLRSLGHNVV